jgi:hypothetical protein
MPRYPWLRVLAFCVSWGLISSVVGFFAAHRLIPAVILGVANSAFALLVIFLTPSIRRSLK